MSIQMGLLGHRGRVQLLSRSRGAERRDQLWLVPLLHNFSAGIKTSCYCKSEGNTVVRFRGYFAQGEKLFISENILCILKYECLFSL